MSTAHRGQGLDIFLGLRLLYTNSLHLDPNQTKPILLPEFVLASDMLQLRNTEYGNGYSTKYRSPHVPSNTRQYLASGELTPNLNPS